MAPSRTAPEDARGDRAVGRPAGAARAEDAALRRRADRQRAGRAARPALQRHSSRRSICCKSVRQIEIVGGIAARRRLVQVSHHRRRADPRRALSRAEPLRRRRRRCRSRSTRPTCARSRAMRRTRRRASASAGRFSHLVRQRPDPRPARPGHQRRPLAVHLRPARQRQDGDGPGASATSSTASIADAACDRGRGPHRPRVRSDQSRAGCWPTSGAERLRRRTSGTTRRWIALPAAAGHGRRRADARADASSTPSPAGFYRAPLQAHRQRRRAGDRRLRPPALLAARAAEPLDRAAREPRGLPDAWRPARSSSCRSRCWSCFATNLRPSELVDEAFLRRIHAKVFARGPDAAGVRADLRDGAARPVASTTIRRSSTHLIDSFYRPRRSPLRGCHPRDLIDHALSLAEYRGEPRELTAELLDARLRRATSSTTGRWRSRCSEVSVPRPVRDHRARRVWRPRLRRGAGSRSARHRRCASRRRWAGPAGAGAIRIVAQVSRRARARCSRCTFFVNGKPVGEDHEGPVYAVEWTDENPFEPHRDCRRGGRRRRPRGARRGRAAGRSSSSRRRRCSSVLLEATVQDRRRPRSSRA